MSNFSVQLFRNIDFDKVRFAKSAYKLDGKHYIDIFYEGQSFYLQSPTGTLKSMTNGVLEVEYDEHFIKFLNKLEDMFQQKVHKHSTHWFGKKQFSLDKIRNSFVSLRNGNVVTYHVGKNMNIFNQYRQQVNEVQPGQKIVILIKLRALEFAGSKFTYACTAEQAKLFTQEELTTYSILDDNQTILESVSSDETSDADYVTQDDNDFF
jgi:hypothetical protein